MPQTKSNIKLSAHYIPGLNYDTTLPPFKANTVHVGLIVQKLTDGTLIVGLNNGWVGKIPSKSLSRGLELIREFKLPKLGDEITVVIHKIQYFSYEGAYSISLDPKEVSDANWFDIEKNNPVGSIASVKIVEKFYDEFVLQTPNGLRGIISANYIHMYLRCTNYEGSVFGLILEAQVSGFNSEKKCLIFSLPQYQQPISHKISISMSVGDKVLGKCIDRQTYQVKIELPFGYIGVLLLFNNWGKELPSIGSYVEATIFHIDLQKDILLLTTDAPIGLSHIFSPVVGSIKNWDDFGEQYRVGDFIEVQNLYWSESWQCNVVNTGLGICGMLSPNEIDFITQERDKQKNILNPGDIFKVVIRKLDPVLRKLTVSKKAFDSQLSEEKISTLKIGDEYDGEVFSKVHYGYFVWLPGFQIQGLLHSSRVPDGQSFNLGDLIRIKIDKIDIVARRVSFDFVELFASNQTT